MNTATILVLAVLVPLAGAAVIGALGRRPNLRETATLTTAIVLFLLVLSALDAARSGDSQPITLATPAPGLSLALHLEPLGMLFALVASGLWIVNSIYSIGYMRGNEEPHRRAFTSASRWRSPPPWASPCRQTC